MLQAMPSAVCGHDVDKRLPMTSSTPPEGLSRKVLPATLTPKQFPTPVPRTNSQLCRGGCPVAASGEWIQHPPHGGRRRIEVRMHNPIDARHEALRPRGALVRGKGRILIGLPVAPGNVDKPTIRHLYDLNKTPAPSPAWAAPGGVQAGDVFCAVFRGFSFVP